MLFIFLKLWILTNILLAGDDSTAVEQPTHNSKMESSNPAKDIIVL
jgi:hypothetical protein